MSEIGLGRIEYPVNWKFPNEYGLSDRTLDCRQIAVMEVMKSLGETRFPDVFLSAFDCIRTGLSLRRSEPNFQLGWHLHPFSANAESIETMIRRIFSQEGYCLLYYNAFDVSFSNYYHLYDLVHWAIVADCDFTGLTLIDDSGSAEYFSNNVARFSWGSFNDAWGEGGKGGVAYLRQDGGKHKDWEARLTSMLNDSTVLMLDKGGLGQLREFVEEFEKTPSEQLLPHLQKLEFELHYYRRLRELWRLAVMRNSLPAGAMRPGAKEELIELCKGWSLVMGVLMKWRRQPHLNYKRKLLNYFEEVLDSERRFFEELRYFAGVNV